MQRLPLVLRPEMLLRCFSFNTIRESNDDVDGWTEAPIVDLGLGGFIAMHALSTRNDDF